MNNISYIKDCYGCGVCTKVCINHIIDIKLNESGFYSPYITDLQKCINCGLCREICSYVYSDLSLNSYIIRSYAAWSNDKNIRYMCSSGGVGFEIGRFLINNGYKVCGVKYNADKKRTEHYIATTINELIPSIGSKYIQSYTVDGFRDINRKDKYLITGTPCQIDSFRRYIKKTNIEKNFILMDFFCHGVPSMLMWQKYIRDIEKKTGKICYASWRNKFAGWHDSYIMEIHGNDNKSSFCSSNSKGDQFYSLFLSNCCLSKACYEKCKFKYCNSSADIRIGDLWGKTYSYDEEGVSAAISFTEKGETILHSVNCKLIEQPFEIVSEGQMKKSPVMPVIYDKILYSLKSPSASINDIIKILKRYESILKLKRLLRNPLKIIMKKYYGD